MKKLLTISFKDLVVMFRDPTALILALLTPFALTLVIGFAFGAIGGDDDAGLSTIPVIIVNQDTGEFGQLLVDVFNSDELDDLLAPTEMEQTEAARGAVETDDAAAVVFIPEQFSESLMPQAMPADGAERPEVTVEIYANPTRSISVGVIRGIVDDVLYRLESGLAAGQISMAQLVMNGRLSMEDAQDLGPEIAERAARKASDTQLVTIQSSMTTGGEESFDWAAYMLPSMAILFLMFTTTAGGQSILSEREEGTLPRMLTSPTARAQVLGGKMGGIYLRGVAQMGILIAANSLLLGARWDSIPLLALVILALVAGATAWGIAVAAFARTPGEANAAGTAISLVFGAASGNFVPRQILPQWLQTVSYITPNSWGLEAFQILNEGATLTDLAGPLIGLTVMTVVLFALSLIAFRRQTT